MDMFDAIVRTFLYLLAGAAFLTAVGVVLMLAWFLLEWLWKREW